MLSGTCFLSIGADINGRNKYGLTALHASTELVSSGTCELLLDLGADPNCAEPVYPSPLHIATTSYRSEISRALIRAGANVEHVVKTGVHYWWDEFYARRSVFMDF